MSEILFSEFFTQKLKERGLTLKQLSETTGIALKHLENLSFGRFENLPPTPYLHGYFEKLGSVLGFDPEEWWNRLKYESVIARSGAADRLPQNRFGKKARRWWMGVGIVVLFLVLYVGFRYSAIFGTPRLVIEEPPAALERTLEDRIVFKGRVENGDDLYLFNEQVPLAADGTFVVEVPLQPGPNPIELTAKKILGREVKVTRQVFYDAPENTFNGLELQNQLPPSSSTQP
jgi:hypothetical protein